VASYELFSPTEVLGRMALERMLAVCRPVVTRSGSNRSVSGSRRPLVRRASPRSRARASWQSRFVGASETALAELLAAPLDGLDLVAVMIDGVHFGEHLCVVALGIGIDGVKHPLGLAEGRTENTSVVTDLLIRLRDRGLDTTRAIFVGIDDGKALRTAMVRVFEHSVIGRCQLQSAAGPPRLDRNQTDAGGLPGRVRDPGRGPA